MKTLQNLLTQSSARHHQLCPRQVLGVRMGMLAGKVLHLELPQTDKRLFAFVECDGCGMGGIALATGCTAERRTMRILDYGKLAATFVDTHTGQAIRIRPVPESRTIAEQALPDSPSAWSRQLAAYQALPDEALFLVQPVELTVSLQEIISQPDLRVNCAVCGEEITNGRQALQGGQAICRACAGDAYYTMPSQPAGSRLNPSPSIPVLTVIGKSGTGKTTLLEKLVRELCRRGYRIAAVKHHSHRGFDIDVPGKDSWRFAQAGSQYVVIAAPDKIASYRLLDHALELDEITFGISGVDLILVEGFRQANKPAIEVVRAVNSKELVGTSEQRIAVAADFPLDLGAPQFGLDDALKIADFIEREFLSAQ